MHFRLGLLVILFGFGILTQSCGAKGSISPMQMDRVYYFDFEVDTITGLHEFDMDKQGCMFTVDKSQFRKMLRHTVEHYDETNVKAKVIELSGEVYFIDAYGVARAENHYFQIDKTAFVRALHMKNYGKCRK